MRLLTEWCSTVWENSVKLWKACQITWKIDLSGIQDWEKEDQHEVWSLITEYGFLFALDDLDLGRTLMVKHTINLRNYTPFKERYHGITPNQYEEVKKHLHEMLKIGTVRQSKHSWSSAVVLVKKKDDSLCFCIDLCKSNTHTIKDAYGLPRIKETLDWLNGACWFSSLDLKSGYW